MLLPNSLKLILQGWLDQQKHRTQISARPRHYYLPHKHSERGRFSSCQSSTLDKNCWAMGSRESNALRNGQLLGWHRCPWKPSSVRNSLHLSHKYSHQFKSSVSAYPWLICPLCSLWWGNATIRHRKSTGPFPIIAGKMNRQRLSYPSRAWLSCLCQNPSWPSAQKDKYQSYFCQLEILWDVLPSGNCQIFYERSIGSRRNWNIFDDLRSLRQTSNMQGPLWFCQAK